MTRYNRGYSNVMRSNRYRPILVILLVIWQRSCCLNSLA